MTSLADDQPVLSVRDLHKDYGKVTAVKGVSFQEANHPAVWIRRSADGLSYEAQQN